MLIPLSREKFEELVPLSATGAQYRYMWGSVSDCLRRLLVSFAAVIAAVIVGYFLGETVGSAFRLIVGIIAGCYWLWGPIFLSSKRNWEYRRYKYSGFWRGEVLDRFVTDELVSTGESVNKRGELVVKENREKRLNLEIGDDTGFTTQVQVPFNRDHQSIRPGDAAEMVVVSSRPDLGRFARISDVYVADSTVWVSDYPYVQRDAFRDVSQRLKQRQGQNDYRDDYLDDYRGDKRSAQASQRAPNPRGDNAYRDDPRSAQGRYLEDDYRRDERGDGYGRERYGRDDYGQDRDSDRYPEAPYPDDRYRPEPGTRPLPGRDDRRAPIKRNRRDRRR